MHKKPKERLPIRQVYIGITGPICGGKSLVSAEIRRLGFPVLDSDKIAKDVVYSEKNHEYLKEIFFSFLFKGDGSIEFDVVREKFYDKTEKGRDLRAIFYEYFRGEIWHEIERQAKKHNSLFVFIENAVLFEYSWENYFNLIICIHCTKEESKRRMLASRKIKLEIFEAIQQIQLPTSEKVRLSHFDINTTNMPTDFTLERVKALLDEIGIVIK